MDDLDDDEEFDSRERSDQRFYWAQRHGKDGGLVDQPTANRLFRSLASGLVERGYFQEWFGYYCVDAEEVQGRAGADPTAYGFRKTRLDGMWPPSDDWLEWDELHLMTGVEFLYDHVSKPVGGRHHTWMQCGWHYDTFNRKAGRELYRKEANEILRDFGDGFELERSGEAVRTIPTGLEELVAEELPDSAAVGDRQTLDHAIRKFRARGSSELDQLDALRTLAGLMEALRPRLTGVFAHKDESDLFEVANRFNIRHAGGKQQGNYDRPIFLPWIFYSHVAAIHAAFRLIQRPDGEA